MNRASSVNDLLYRFREMSLYRDRVLQDNGTSPLTKDGVPLTFFERSKKLQEGITQTPHNVFLRKHSFNDGTPWTRGLRHGRGSDMVHDKNHFSSPNKRRNSFVECGGGGNKANKVHCEPKVCRSTRSTAEDKCDANAGVHVQWNINPQSAAWGPVSCQLSNNERPVWFFVLLARAVAKSRGVRSPPIPREVISAYEKYVRGGTSILKFVKYDAPHKRFFVITFLNKKIDDGMPVAALCWYKTQQSCMMKRYLPLADLVEVIFGGEGHPAVQKRMAKSGLIKGSPVNMGARYLKADFIQQWRFKSSTGEEEVLAVMLPNRESFIAWYIVFEFFSKIGSTPVVATS